MSQFPRFAPWLGAVLSGVLLILCFPPFEQGWLGWFALTPLLAALWYQPARPARWPRARAFGLAFLSGAVFFIGTFHWLTKLALLFESPALNGVPVLLGLYLSLYFGFWGWFAGTVLLPRGYRFSSSAGNLALGAVAASAWVTQEWVRGWLFSGFSWNGLGLTIRHLLSMVQIVDLTGVYGLSWLVCFANVMAVIIVRRLIAELGPQFLKRIRWEFSATMAVICAVFAYGVHRLLEPPHRPVLEFRAVLLQPNIPEDVKKFGGAEKEDEILAQLAELNQKAVESKPSPLLIIWPEAAVPRGVYADEQMRDFVLQQARRGAYSLLLGTLDYDLSAAPDGGELVYNGAMLFSRGGRQQQTYHKMHLVPWGEYLPLRRFMPAALEALVPGDLAFGREASVLTLDNPPLRLGALVCFEDTLGNLTGGFVRAGADLLVNLTNDSWFLESPGAEQHLANDMLRAVEMRRPLVRCTNTGITCVVTPLGRIERLIPPFKPGIAPVTLRVPFNAPITFYAQHGDWLAHGSVILTLAWLVRAGLRRRASPVH